MGENSAVFAKAAARLLPFMALLYIVNFIDRVNVGFAALTMDKDLGIGAEAFGFIGGVFSLGYFFFEVPSNVILERVGARLWIFRIMLTWGLVSMATALAHNFWSLVALRFALGVTEAGFYPGMILYLSFWFPSAYLARFTAIFLASVPLASVIGGPLSGLVLGMNGVAHLQGWQWLFLIEGVPSFLLSFAVLRWLPNGPKDARWLNEAEKQTITTRLAADPPRDHHKLWPMLKDARVWLLIIPDFLIVLALYGVGLWLPQMVHAMGFSNIETGFVVAMLYTVSVLVSLAWAVSSDRHGERIWHVVAACGVAALGMTVTALMGVDVASIAALTIAAAGIYASVAVFWTMPSSFLGGTAAAGGIALINSFANLGGFAGPFLVGWLKQTTGGYAAGMGLLAVSLIAAAAMVLVLGRSLRLRAHSQG